MLVHVTPLVCHYFTFNFPNTWGDIIPLYLMVALEWANQINCCLFTSSELASSGLPHFSRSDPSTFSFFLCSIQFTHYCHISFLNFLHEPLYLFWRTYSGSLWYNRWNLKTTVWWLSYSINSVTDSYTLGCLSIIQSHAFNYCVQFCSCYTSLCPFYWFNFYASSKLSSNALSLGHPNLTTLAKCNLPFFWTSVFTIISFYVWVYLSPLFLALAPWGHHCSFIVAKTVSFMWKTFNKEIVSE